jgi:DNA polymerase V
VYDNQSEFLIKETMMPRGGARQGAGRPKGRNQYGEPTKPVRIPESMVSRVLGYVKCKGYALPLYSSKVAAGFPSPADDHIEGKLDLNEHLISNPTATFFVRAKGDSMLNAGIHSNDILVVDRSITPKSGHIVIVALNGELTVKRLKKQGQQVTLLAENPDYPSIKIAEGEELVIWGVVTSVVHELK